MHTPRSRRAMLAGLCLLMTLLACNLPALATPAPPPLPTSTPAPSLTPTPSVLSVELAFPTVDDARVFAHGSRPWSAGDAIVGVRMTALDQATQVAFKFVIPAGENTLTCDTQRHQLVINEMLVGAFEIGPGDTGVAGKFTFAPIPGPTFTLRLVTAHTVASSCGSAGFADGVSRVVLSR